ncbi:MAG: PstS family phosphate ABC transporter substrate-binding protein [Candidatus Omnitrophota bacterium]
MKRRKKILAGVLSAVLFFSSSAYAREGVVQIKGSDTLINLVQRLSEVYMRKKSGSAIAVTGGGSGTGIAALINGKCDIANASRDIKGKEIEQAVANGVDPKRIVVAIDGLSVIVNNSNPLKQLTMGEIGQIFRGEITNWKELGGNDEPVTLYGRQSNSGTFVLFMELVLKADYSPKMRRMNGNSQIVEAVKSDKTGIGYVGVGYVKNEPDVTVLKVAQERGGVYASPLNVEDVKTGKYPIARPLNQYVNGSPEGAIRDFIAFELSPEGQAIVEEDGFFTVPPEYMEYNRKNAGL